MQLIYTKRKIIILKLHFIKYSIANRINVAKKIIDEQKKAIKEYIPLLGVTLFSNSH